MLGNAAKMEPAKLRSDLAVAVSMQHLATPTGKLGKPQHSMA